MRDRLIDILQSKPYGQSTYEEFADYLLKNGVICLPCKVGDIVYIKFIDIVIERRCVGFRYSEEMQLEYIVVELITQKTRNVKHQPIHISKFGETVFFTKEEAEKALRGEGE